MAAYILAQITIHDRERYSLYENGFFQGRHGEEFVSRGGKFLSVDEAPVVLEGSVEHTRTVLVEFPTQADLEAWHHSEGYQELVKHRHAASTANLVILRAIPS